MGLFLAPDGSGYRRWVNVIPSLLISGAGHYLSGRKRAAVLWFMITMAFVLGTFGLVLFAPIRNSFPLAYYAYASVRLTVVVLMLIDSCRKPIPRLKFRSWAMLVGVAVAIIVVPFLLVRQFVFQPFSIPTGAMQPTLMGITRTSDGEKDGDHFLLNKTAYWFHEPQRGDIVVFETRGLSDLSPPGSIHPGDKFVKRVAAIPGDKISIDAPFVLIGGQRLTNPPIFARIAAGSNGFSGYVNLGRMGNRGSEITLGPDEYFVLGDNGESSLDSRYFGPIKRGSIRGKVTRIYEPPERRGELE